MLFFNILIAHLWTLFIRISDVGGVEWCFSLQVCICKYSVLERQKILPEKKGTGTLSEVFKYKNIADRLE